MGRMNTKNIYKITNRINGKSYIGQSNDCNRRFQEHIRGDHCTSLIHLAIKKYGIQNFDLTILEHNIENFNEQEQFWIKYYKTNNRDYGYNILAGGENPPTLTGEDSSLAKISNKTFHEIEETIQNSKLSFIEIAQKYGLSETYISQINRGIARRTLGLLYPLRPSQNLQIEEEKIDKIIYELTYTHLPIEHIAKKYKISNSTIYRINNGEKYKKNDIDYPIRNKNSKISNWMLNYIVKDIKENKIKFSEIEKKYNLSKSTINRINQGKILRKENEFYPLRNSKQRLH